MTYVVTETCIRCKYMDCVEVCPVDCFYVGENMLVIHPDECIDCGVCEPECPVEAIVPDSDDKAGDWLEQNRTYAALWPNITRKGEPPADADEWKDKPDKAKLLFAQSGQALSLKQAGSAAGSTGSVPARGGPLRAKTAIPHDVTPL